MLVVQTAGAPAAASGRFRRRPRPREAAPGSEPAQIPLTSLTVVSADPLADAAAGDRWLDELTSDPEALEGEVLTALVIANQALHTHAVASQDASLAQMNRSAPLASRVGYGRGEDLADGRWTRAVEVPPPSRRARRAEALRPAERLAAVLGGRERLDVCETLLLRTRADLDAGRNREAALQLRIGAAALLAELGDDPGPDQEDDLAALSDRRAATAALAEAALNDEPSDDELAALEETLAIAERVLRRRRILGAGRG